MSMELDLGDFDAVGILGAVVGGVRMAAIERGVDVAATVSAPEGWAQLVVTGRPSGHAVLSVRHDQLSRSRWHNLVGVLRRLGWDDDEDGDGATRRYPPGTEPSGAAFEALTVLAAAGAPSDVRTITVRDATGAAVPLDL